jgi:protein-L-isoaspartate(D-aspartate) O-methyltransferase
VTDEHSTLLNTMVDDVIRSGGDLADQTWEAVFRRVPRHPFVDTFYVDSDAYEEGFRRVDAREPDWLRLVYSDVPLLTRLDDVGRALSSSSMPSMMARFLHLLDVSDGDTVLEIGTGTGYNAALLSERVGAENVTSIDIDPGCVESAGVALASCHLAPTLAVGDGMGGYPLRAPYDRVIVTCAVSRIPDAWVDQLHPDGVIVTPLMGRADGALVALRGQPDGSLQGRLDRDGAGFMALRQQADRYPQDVRWSELFHVVHEAEGGVVRTCVVPEEMGRRFMGFVTLDQPDLAWFPTLHAVASRVDRSWARVCDGDDGATSTVRQGGARRLWDLVEVEYERWRNLGCPTMDRFGVTITPDRRQSMWLDSPDSEHRWEL